MSETYNTPPPSCAGSVCLFSLQQTSDMLPGPNTAPEDGTEGDPASIQHLPAMAQQPDAMNRMNSILGGTLDLSNINTAEQTRVSDAIQMAEIMGLADLSRTTRASEHHSSSSDEVNIIVSDMMRDQKQAVQQPQGRAIRGAGPSQSTPRKESAMEFPRPSLENAGAGGGEWNINDIMAILATQKQQQQPLRAPPATPASVAPQSAAGLYESLYRTPASVNPVLDPALAAGLVYPFMSTPDSQYSDSINRSPAPDLSALSSDSSALSMAYLRDIMANLSLSQHTPGRSPTSPLMLPQRNVLDESALFSADMRTRVNAWNNLFATNMTDPFSIEKAARLYRNAAAVCDATCTWSGQLPPRNYKNPVYSCKVFVGGVPWDITELALVQAFKQFGTVHVEWPGKEARYAKAGARPSAKGYVYIIFDSEKSVKALLQNCQRDYSNSGDWYFKLTTRRLRTKEIRQVQVIPWVISDSTYVRCNNQRMDPNKTVFVGALHGMVTAEVLALVMNDLFGGVVYAGIDTDKYKYPIGSGRVTFNNQKSYFKAVMAAFVEIKSPKFTKKVQIDPYLEDAVCSNCGCAAGPYFCREMICFRYFCRQCWQGQHGSLDSMRYHKPLMRNTRTGAAIRATRLPDMPGPGTSNGSYQQVNPTAHLSGRLPSGVPQFGVPPPILPYCIPRASG